MKTGTKLFIAAVSVIILCACTAARTGSIKKADWLVGTWENNTPKGTIYETCKKISDNEFLGKSYMLEQQDTIVFETMRVVQEQHGLSYNPIVKNQNDALPVRFAGKTISENKLVFENPQHDFPQTISYAKIHTDSLVAEISGTRNGQERKQTFPMKRARQN